MKHELFSIYDEKAESYLPPFTLPNVQMAKREFASCTNDTTHKFCAHPNDFILYKIGEFDDSLGTITQDKHENLGYAREYKTAPPEIDDLLSKLQTAVNKIQELSK